MHNLFLGELRHHCIDIWGMKTAEDRGKPKRKNAAVHTPGMQQSVLDHLIAALRKGAQSAVTSIQKDYLEALVKYNPSVSTLAKSAQTKPEYAAVLMEWVASAPNGVDSLMIPPVLPYATNKKRAHAIFSSQVLEAIRKDIASVTLPSWLPRPPQNLGSASHGKLKADHWCTACTVNMVITLVRLWSDPSATQDEKSALSNFLHLVAAADLATRRTMSSERSQRFDAHMLEYVWGLRSLYRASLVPNHHLSLHLVDCLQLFGPTFAWWAFPFERYNGLLQRLNTNHRTADIPKTFMRYFYIGARVRSMIPTDAKARPDHPEFKDVMNTFHSAFQEVARGSRVIHPSAFFWNDKQVLSGSLYEALLRAYASRYYPSDGDSPFLPSTATFLPSLAHSGVTISTFEDRPGNSFVLFRDGSNGDTRVRAGQVRRIFQHTRIQDDCSVTDTYLVVGEYTSLSSSHAAFDPYRCFPHIEAWLCYNKMGDADVIVPLSNFVSHFTSYTYTPPEIGVECMVIKLLDRWARPSVYGGFGCERALEGAGRVYACSRARRATRVQLACVAESSQWIRVCAGAWRVHQSASDSSAGARCTVVSGVRGRERAREGYSGAAGVRS
ncbi:hypothetical protein C8Q70DRAFT_1045994 [Cubamyces menziesii]|nr:hypothetical protein C8Q70DRAFT_1045994 [Cubamyces menziesii]